MNFESEIYFRQLNCQHGTVATVDIQTRLNQIHLLTEPYFTSTGEVGVDDKNKCVYDVSAVNTVEREYPRAAIYAPNMKDAILMPVHDLMSRDMATVSMENRAAEKPLLIVSMYFENSKDENGQEKDPKFVITPDLIRVTEYAKDNSMQLLIGADVNAWSSLWFSDRDNPRGDKLSEFLIVNGFEIHNNRKVHTWAGGNAGASTIDVTMSLNLTYLVKEWDVDETSAISDHKPITFMIGAHSIEQTKVRPYTKTDWEKFNHHVETRCPHIKSLEGNWSEEDIESQYKKLFLFLDKVMDKHCPWGNRRIRDSHIWWNEECEHARRKLRNAGRKIPRDREEVHRLRLLYKKEIWAAKRQSWRDFISEVDSTHQMSKVKKIIKRTRTQEVGLLRKPDGTKCQNSEEVISLLLEEHFPRCNTEEKDETIPSRQKVKVTPFPWLNIERLKTAIKLFGPHKGAGPDGIKPIVLQNLPDNFLEGFSTSSKTIVAGSSTW